MKLHLRKILATFLFGIAVSSCYYDKESVLYPAQASCNTPATVSYGQQVLPILQQSCYGCHSGTAPGGNIAMGTYAADNAIAINGKLYGSISWSPGFQPMPLGAGKLSACNIALIKKWIDNGAPNN
jgi:mono/diheme cytochrome c family protein